MLSRRFATILDAACRASTAIVLAAMLLPWTPGPSPVRADEHEPNRPGEEQTESVVPRQVLENVHVLEASPPAGRLEFEIKKIIVHDDSDPDVIPYVAEEGEFTIRLRVWEVTGDCAPDAWYCYEGTDIVRSADIKFDADTGETVTLNRVVPGPGDWVLNDSIGPGIGFPVYAGQRYGYKIEGIERDEFFDDEAGDLVGLLAEHNGWGPLGTVTERGYRDWSDLDGDFCKRVGTPIGCARARFSAEYEVRRTPLPDLHIRSMRVEDRPGARQPHLCATVENIGPRESGHSQIVFYLDGQVSSTSGLSAIAAGASREECNESRPLEPGQYTIAARLDGEDEVAEMDETNNDHQQAYGRTLAPDVANPGNTVGATQDTGPTTNPGQRRPISVGSEPIQIVQADQAAGVDLAVTAIRVRDKQPTGNNDCDPGENDVTVVVKNQGTAPASSFAVRLVVDDKNAEAKERPVARLDPGKDVTVQFDDLDLKRGPHRLSATADAKSAVAESDELNTNYVDVRCENE